MHTSLCSIYRRRGGLRQDPGHGAESLAWAGSCGHGVAKCMCSYIRPGTSYGPPVHTPSARSRCRPRRIGADDVNPLSPSAFDLPERLAPKADPRLIAGDEQHFVAIAE